MSRVQEIGAYAGFAAVIGLAVLSALYFSQARDVKRLREWAGRAPERAAEEESRIAAQASTAQQQRAAAGMGGAPTMAPPPPPTTLPGTGSATPAPGSLPSPRPAPTVASTPSTPILSRPPEPWYKRVVWPEPRYIALIVAGVIVIGGGAAYGISHLVNDNGGSPGKATATTKQSSNAPATTTKAKPAPRVVPSKVTVAVLNGTTVTGLASETANKLVQLGFQRGNTSNADTQGQQAQSVVEYSGNNARAARLVANRLGISDIEPIDAQTQVKAGDATVTVIIGADRANGG
jgi:LytR cell envelope-related transcriptional attenuator